MSATNELRELLNPYRLEGEMTVEQLHELAAVVDVTLGYAYLIARGAGIRVPGITKELRLLSKGAAL